MVEKRASSGGGDFSPEYFENLGNQQPSGQERLTAVARLIEMAKEVGVEVPADSTIDQVHDALLQEETFLAEQFESANVAYDDYVEGEEVKDSMTDAEKALVDVLITNRIPLPEVMSVETLQAALNESMK